MGAGQTGCSAPSHAQKPDQKLTFSDIAYIYHGAPVDRNFRVIQLDRQRISDILDSMVQTLSTPRAALDQADGKSRPSQPAVIQASDVTRQTRLFSTAQTDPLLVKVAILSTAIRRLPSSEGQVLRERLGVLRQALGGSMVQSKLAPGSKLLQALAAPAPGASANADSYAADCKAAGVPIPPDWPNAAWIDRGALPPNSTFASFPNTVTSKSSPTSLAMEAASATLCRARMRRALFRRWA